MTTEYRDKTGKLLRTDTGTQPRALTPAAPLSAPAATAPTIETTDAIAPAKKEK